jgi:competence protein ComEA
VSGPSTVEALEEAKPFATPGGRLVGLWDRIRAGEEPVAFGAIVIVIAMMAGLAWFWAGARSGGAPAAAATGSRSADAPSSSPSTPNPALTSTTNAPLAVHVAGAVARPGLYHLPAGSRVADALARAGGRLPAADVDRLNLAARLADGQKILVTRLGEPVPTEVFGGLGGSVGIGGSAAVSAEPAGGVPPEPIDLNNADLAALDSLPGIGPATARAILEERARRGGFRSTRDLLRVPGIGEGRFARLKDRVRV